MRVANGVDEVWRGARPGQRLLEHAGVFRARELIERVLDLGPSLTVGQRLGEVDEHFAVQSELANARVLDHQLCLPERERGLGLRAQRDHRRRGLSPREERYGVGRGLQVDVDLGAFDRQPAMVRIDAPPRTAVLPREGLARESGGAGESEIEHRDHPLPRPGIRDPAPDVEPGRAPGRTPAVAALDWHELAADRVGIEDRFASHLHCAQLNRCVLRRVGASGNLTGAQASGPDHKSSRQLVMPALVSRIDRNPDHTDEADDE